MAYVFVVQRELEIQRKETERVQAELLTLKAENAKLVAAASKFFAPLDFSSLSGTSCFLLVTLLFCLFAGDHAASLSNARKGYISEAESKSKIAEVEQGRLQLTRELDEARTARDDWQGRALAAEKELKKNRAASDGVIIEQKKKYRKLKSNMLKQFHTTLGKCPMISWLFLLRC